MMVEKLKAYQRIQYSDDPGALPSVSDVELEIFYNKTNVFSRLKYLYALLGLILLPLTLIHNLKEDKSKSLLITIRILIGVYGLGLLFHIATLALRTYITGHAPWSDGYEALVTVSAACILAGMIFMSRSIITVGGAAIIGFFVLMTAGHNQYDPQMSDLEPVLKSYWLNIHVACLTISYGFFGLSFILALINMGIFSSRGTNNIYRTESTLTELTYVNEMTMTIGLVLATIGTFLGGVWANESWGRYWGWDAKETWALVIVLVYAFILHMRFVPGLRGNYALNLASGIGFSSVLFTFIGVNYYLTKGLHSYARGDAPAFPIWVWVLIAAIVGLFALAGIKERKIKRLLNSKK
jgi:cytochrome c-type biogenesis protein CcsB